MSSITDPVPPAAPGPEVGRLERLSALAERFGEPARRPMPRRVPYGGLNVVAIVLTAYHARVWQDA